MEIKHKLAQKELISQVDKNKELQ